MIPDAVIQDPRSIEQKSFDHLHEEKYMGIPVLWIEKPQSTWSLAPQRLQDGSYSCVMQGGQSAIYKILKQNTSAAMYQLRTPHEPGMYLQNAADILKNVGTDFEVNLPSQNMNDAQLDSIQLPTKFRIKITGYNTFASIGIDAIAQAIQAYGNCNLTFKSNGDEWQLTPVFLGTTTTFGHDICGVDFTLINGFKTIVCMDSAGNDSSPTGVRLITEDFLNKRCTGAICYTGAILIPDTFKHVFTTNLSQGQSGDEVKALQEALRIDGEFTYPTDTGTFGPVTLAAVKAFQLKYGIPNTGFVGPLTRTKLNSLFS